MRHLLLIATILFSFGYAQAQSSFSDETDVMSYMDGKSFYNSENGLTIKYGYISSYNTYGIIVTNKNAATFYFINVDITVYDTFADLYGMSADDGSNFGFRLFKGRLVVGYGEPSESTFYLR